MDKLMNPLIPDQFKINGDLVVRLDQTSLQESMVTLAMVVIIVIIVALLAQRFIKQM